MVRHRLRRNFSLNTRRPVGYTETFVEARRLESAMLHASV